MGQMFDEKLDEYLRKGDRQKVKWMQNIGKIIMPSQTQKIINDDKTVMRELFVPKWVDWELLRDWALGRPRAKASMCILCNNHHDLGLVFNGKFVCQDCFMKIKGM